MVSAFCCAREFRCSCAQKSLRCCLHYSTDAARRRARVSLLREVWGYDDSTISRTADSHTASLRARVEDNPEQPRYILTVRKVGYRIRL